MPAYVSRRAAETGQGATLGALQSAGALARAVGPMVGGALSTPPSLPAPRTLVGAAGFALAALLALARLR